MSQNVSGRMVVVTRCPTKMEPIVGEEQAKRLLGDSEGSGTRGPVITLKRCEVPVTARSRNVTLTEFPIGKG